jgi:hypothetical protein
VTEQERDEKQALAKGYRDAAGNDAWHQLVDRGKTASDDDKTLVPTHEVDGVPLSDVAHPDPVDSENHNAPPSPLGPHHDALMRGLEPGEN